MVGEAPVKEDVGVFTADIVVTVRGYEGWPWLVIRWPPIRSDISSPSARLQRELLSAIYAAQSAQR